MYLFLFYVYFFLIFLFELKYLIIFIFKKNIILSLNKILNSLYGFVIIFVFLLEIVFVLDYVKFKYLLIICIR